MPLELTSYHDLIQPFLIHHSSIRGRVVRLSKVVDDILNRHDYPVVISKLLAEMCVLAIMLSSNLKGKGKLTMQLRGEGDLQFMVVDITADGALRGYAQLRDGALFSADTLPLGALVGKGYLAITLVTGDTPYQGVVDLQGNTLSECVQHYFSNSEQSVVYVKTAVGQREEKGKSQWCAGGLMMQHVPSEGGIKLPENAPVNDANLPDLSQPATMPETVIETWNRNTTLAKTTKDAELLDVYLSPQALLYRLFNEDGVWVYDAQNLRDECSCSRSRVHTTLAQFPMEELQTMLKDDKLEVICQFCNRAEYFTLEELGGE